ncbi:MAG: chloramphenicol resistance protein [Eubacterium sp.]
MAIIEAVRDYVLTCPLLEDFARINVDFLPEDASTYSIESVPTQTIMSTNIDGSTTRQFVFVFASRLLYTEELRNNIDNSGFYEAFENWLEENSKNGILPDLGDKLTPVKIEAMSSGYLFDIAGDFTMARYQIQCRLIYERE